MGGGGGVNKIFFKLRVLELFEIIKVKFKEGKLDIGN